MGLYDRPYLRDDDEDRQVHFGRLRLGLPRPATATLVMILICAVLFLLKILPGLIWAITVVYLGFSPSKAYEVWRFITFQFVHADTMHFMWNMVGLYFFATPLERAWGPRRFVAFYLSCGVGGALLFMLICSIWWGLGSSLIGASGGILGCLMACAILYPEMLIFIFPIRWVAAFCVVLYVLTLTTRENPADAAHLGGMVAAAGWIWLAPRVGRALASGPRLAGRGRWQRKLARRRQVQEDIDGILDKIHREGLDSLSWRERRILRDATRQRRHSREE